MITNTIHGSNNAEPAIRNLLNRIKDEGSLTGQLVTGYPLFPIEGRRPYSPDAVLVSAQGQVTIIDVTDEKEPGDVKERHDLGFNQIRSRLCNDRRMRRGRQLKLHLQTVTYGPNLKPESINPGEPDYPVVDDRHLTSMLHTFQKMQDLLHSEAGLNDDAVMSVLCHYRHDWGEG